ncbi:hypothetical protein [Mycolicibacterium sp. PDY-3]
MPPARWLAALRGPLSVVHLLRRSLTRARRPVADPVRRCRLPAVPVARARPVVAQVVPARLVAVRAPAVPVLRRL